MRRGLIAALSAGFAILAFAKPAVSMPSTATPHFGETSGGVVYIDHKDRHWRGRPYYRGYAYGYRPYYRPYAYYRPYSYYRPYAYYGYPYYYRRPGISLQFGF
jgi:hypothetical protein